MERPLVGPVLALMCGMSAAWLLECPSTVGLSLALAGLLSFALSGRGWEKVRLRIACALVGVGHLAVWNDADGPREVSAVVPSEPTLGWVRGVVSDPGEVKEVRGRPGVMQRMVEMRVDGWRARNREWQPVDGHVRVRFRDARGMEVRRGMVAEVFGIFQKPKPPWLPGGFDYGAHLRARGIRRVGESEGANDWHPVGQAPLPGPADRFLPWAHGTLSKGVPDDAATRLIRSMVLGWRGGLEEEWREAFMESGTLHVFAISGLHIALVAGGLVEVLRLARMRREWCVWVVIPVVWFYVAATGWQASAVRSAVMSTVVVAGWALRRPPDLLNSLAASAWVILAVDPGQLFQAGFQLSFGVVAGMAVWVRPVEGWLEQWLGPDPLVAESTRGWFARLGISASRWLAVNLAASIAAWVTSVPLGVHHFQLVSFSGLVANLLVVPVSGLCLMAGLLSLLLAPVWEGASVWMNQSAWFWMELMMQAGKWASRMPGGHWAVEAPWWGWWSGYACVLFVVGPRWVMGWPLGWRWMAPLGGWTLAAGLAVGVALQTTRVTCLPWGAGVLVEEGWTSETLVDCGPAVFARRSLPEWLRSRGIERITDAVGAAGESRFAGGWPELMAGVGVGAFWVGPEGRSGSALRQAHEAAHDHGVPIRRLSAGRRVGPWEVLWPEEGGEGSRSDDHALVLAGKVGGVRCCLIPSLNPEAQRRLIARHGERLRTDIVIAGVPGRGEPLVPELLACLRPEAVVLLASDRPASLKPSRALRQRLRASVPGGAVWFTDEVGAVQIMARSGQWRMVAGTEP
jgi:ComEC/Rec2-related protein